MVVDTSARRGGGAGGAAIRHISGGAGEFGRRPALPQVPDGLVIEGLGVGVASVDQHLVAGDRGVGTDLEIGPAQLVLYLLVALLVFRGM